jgi:hypothetical protein
MEHQRENNAELFDTLNKKIEALRRAYIQTTDVSEQLRIHEETERLHSLFGKWFLESYKNQQHIEQLSSIVKELWGCVDALLLIIETFAGTAQPRK